MFIELVSRLVGASGAEAVISPNRRDHDAAAPMPTGTAGPLTALPAPPTELTTRARALTKKKTSTPAKAFSAFTGIVEIVIGKGDRLVLQSGTNMAAGVASTASSVVALRRLAANCAGPSRRKATDVANLRMTDGRAAEAPFHQRRGMVCRGGAPGSGGGRAPNDPRDQLRSSAPVANDQPAAVSSAKTESSPAEAIYKPPSLTLPKGGGALRSIGETFKANPVTGTGGLTIPLPLSAGRAVGTPSLALAYDTGAGQGAFGIGWSVALPSIARKTDKAHSHLSRCTGGGPMLRAPSSLENSLDALSVTLEEVPCLA